MNTSQTNRPKRTLAAICWFALLISLKFGGPFGFLKLSFCEYPFAHITSIGYYPEPGATERELDDYQQDVRLSEGRVEIALIYTWIGGLLYFATVIACIIFLARRHEDRLYLSLILVAAAVFLVLAISEREVQFGVSRLTANERFLASIPIGSRNHSMWVFARGRMAPNTQTFLLQHLRQVPSEAPPV